MLRARARLATLAQRPRVLKYRVLSDCSRVGGSPIRHDFSTFVMVTAMFMVISMLVFPEAGVKKGDLKKVK